MPVSKGWWIVREREKIPDEGTAHDGILRDRSVGRRSRDNNTSREILARDTAHGGILRARGVGRRSRGGNTFRGSGHVD